MSIFETKTNLYLSFGITLLLAIFLPIFSQNFVATLLFLLIIFWGLLAVSMPRLGLLLILLLRPCLDFWTSAGFLSIGEKSLNFASILSLILLLIAGVMLWKRQTDFKVMPLRFFWLGLITISALSIFWSFSTVLSLAETLRLFSIFAIFFYAYSFTETQKDLERLLQILTLSGLIPSILAIYQYISDTGLTMPFEGIYNRIYGTFAHPNLLAYYLLLPIVSALYLTLKEKKNEVLRIVYGFATVFFTLILIMTYTRGAWLALFVVIVLLGVFKYRNLLLGSLVLILIAYALIQPIQNRVNDLINNPYSSIDWRQDLWKDAKGYVKEKPILGQGTGVAKDYIAEKRGPQFGSSDPHNDYLKILLETGYAGLALYLGLVVNLLYLLIRNFRHQNNTDLNLIILGLSLALFSLSYADNILRNTALNWGYWAIIGAHLKLSQKK